MPRSGQNLDRRYSLKYMFCIFVNQQLSEVLEL
jgi:hypothetical protein